MTELERRIRMAALEHPCPSCAAAVDAPCVRRSGTKITKPHGRRLQLAVVMGLRLRR